jgi:hypothetical protein
VSPARCVASLTALVTCMAGAGCGTGDDERRVRSVTDRFYAALHGHAGERACAQLSENAVNALECARGRGRRRAGRGGLPRPHGTGLADLRRRLPAEGRRPLRLPAGGLTVRAVFVAYLCFITAGIAYAIVIGLLHQ